MTSFLVVDARPGRGKSLAAVRYMEERKGTDAFICITPRFKLVSSACEDACNDPGRLKELLEAEANISISPLLFRELDTEALRYIRLKRYSLIVDDTLEVVRQLPMGKADKDYLFEHYVDFDDETGVVEWTDEDVDDEDAPKLPEEFSVIRESAIVETLFWCGRQFVQIIPPTFFQRFKQVIVIGYMTDVTQIIQYFELCSFNYKVIGVTADSDGPMFSEQPDKPPPLDCANLLKIHITTDNRFMHSPLDIGAETGVLSRRWLKKAYASGKKIHRIYNNLRTFFQRRTNVPAEMRMWTASDEVYDQMFRPYSRFSSSFVPMNEVPPERFRCATAVAYLADPEPVGWLVSFFRQRGIVLDNDRYALRHLLRFIGGSAVRDGTPIDLYVYSHKMLWLLTEWLEEQKCGGVADNDSS